MCEDPDALKLPKSGVDRFSEICRMIVLQAALKAINSILTNVFCGGNIQCSGDGIFSRSVGKICILMKV